MTDYLAIGLAIASLTVSIATAVFSFFWKGRLTFPSVNFIGAQAYAKREKEKIELVNDRIVIPLTATNSGVRPRSLRFKAVVNGKWVYHNSLHFSEIKLPNPSESMTLDDFHSISRPFVIMPRSSETKIIGFTQQPLISGLRDLSLSLDVWYQEDEDTKNWKRAFRIDWDQWPKLAVNYSNGNFVSSLNLKFNSSFDITYDPSILCEN